MWSRARLTGDLRPCGQLVPFAPRRRPLAVGLPNDAVNAFDLEWVEGPAREPAAI
jgi:hypothetical protein